MAQLRVLIVGCGNIAGVFDVGRPTSEFPSTHAGAYVRDGRFRVTACVDPDEARRRAFMDAWGIPTGFESLDEVLNSEGEFDVVSICSPTHCHAHDLEMVLRLKPKLIFCEKPLTTSSGQSERLVKECVKSNIPLAVNYTRRWDPEVSRLKSDLQTGRLGALRTVVGYYNKGILNNGSHMLDLLHFLVGPLHIVKAGKPICDFFSDDPSIPVSLEGQNGLPVQLVCGHAADYTIFELQLVFSSGAITMEEGGMFWRERRAVASVNFKGYSVLEGGVRRDGSYSQAMLQAVDNIYCVINRGDALENTGESALSAQSLCEQIKQHAFALQ